MDTSGSISISLKGPTLQNLNAYVRPLIACVWYDLGLQLLDQEDRPKLDTIKANKLGDVEGACTEMFALWLKKNPSASWSLLIDTIKGPGVGNYNAADKIERLLQQATTPAVNLLTSSDKSISWNYSQLFCQSKTVGAAYASLMSKLGTVLEKDVFPSLKRAVTSQFTVPGFKVRKQLRKAINLAKTSDDLLDTLQQSSGCNWLDTRLLEALACGSSQPAACELIEAYKNFLHHKKLNEVLSDYSKSEIQEPYAVRVGTKIDMNPKEITVGALLKHRGDLEDVIINLGKGIVKISHVKQGCLEVIYSMPAQFAFAAYKNTLNRRHKFCRISLLYLKYDNHPVIYDPWLFDLEKSSTKRKEIFYEYEVATQLCDILLENAPVDDIITVFSSHDLLIDDDLAVVTNAPSDHLKKMFLLRRFQNVSLSVWLTICDVANKSEILKHLSDQLVFEQKSLMQPQLELISVNTDSADTIDEQPLVTHCLLGTNMSSMDDNATASVFHFSPKLSQRKSSFCHLHCLKHIKPATVEMLFQYTVRHVTELLSYCDPNLLMKWCQNLMASNSHQIKLFTTNFTDKLKQLKTSRDLLKLLSHYWNWSNFSILKALAQFSKLAVDMLEEFDTRLNTMLPITKYPVASLAVSMFPYDTSSYTVLTFECDQNLNHSLQLVLDMQSLITEYCDITQHALLLLGVENDPTRLHWMIPKSVVTIVNTSVMQCSQLLFSKRVTRIFIYPSTVHVLDMALTVWPYMFSNENVKEDATKVMRPPNDQLRMLQHVRKQRDGWSTEAKQNKQFEENFRKGFKKEEQKYNKLKEQVTKEAQAVVKFKEKFASCKDNLESIIKVLAGDSANLPTVVEPTKEFTQIEGVQQLEQDIENLEQLTKHLLVKSIEQREEQFKSFQQYEQKFQQKEKEIEDLKSEISAKDNKLDCYKKTEKELYSLSSKLKLQRDRLNVELEECNNKLKECQTCLKSKDDDFSAACVKIEEMRHHTSQLEELAKKGEEIISHQSINEELTLKNLKLQQRIEELESQHQKLQDDFYAENKRLKQQLKASNDESKHKCDRCGSMNRKVVKYTSDNFVCLAHDEYHFFCTDCYKRSYYCPVHSEINSFV